MQVCHHPPIGAAHAEGKGWTYDIVSAPTTRFNGNSVDVFPLGVRLDLQPVLAEKIMQPSGCCFWHCRIVLALGRCTSHGLDTAICKAICKEAATESNPYLQKPCSAHRHLRIWLAWAWACAQTCVRLRIEEQTQDFWALS